MMNSQNEETALWDAFIAGDKMAYSEIYRLYYPRLFNYGRKFTLDVNLLEDCIQEMFIQFWIGRQKLATVQSRRSYLFVSFRRSLLRTEQLSRRVNPLAEEDSGFSLELSIDQVMIDKERIYERNVNLKAALDKLTGRQKEAVFFMFYEGMTYEEIADILQISKKATYKLMARAIRELRSIYKQNAASWLLSLSFIFLQSVFQ